MSCHDIGRGLNSVTQEIINQYNLGKFDKDTFRILLNKCRKGVHWCDGNEDEAVIALEENKICGFCLEKVENISNIYDNNLEYPQCYDVFDKYDKTAAHFMVCDKCKEKIIKEFLKQG